MCVCLHTLTECRCLLHCTDYFRPVNILAGLPGVYCFILSSLFLILERYERNSFNWCCCAYILMSLCRLWLFKECLVIQVAQNIVGRNSAYTECVFTAQRSQLLFIALCVAVLETCFLILNLHGGDQKMPISFKDNIPRQPADQSFALDC